MNIGSAAQASFPAAAFVAALMAGAMADPIPQAWLQNQKTACLSSCASHGGSGEFCGPYCECVNQQTQGQFTSEQYMTLTQALTNNQPAPQASQNKLKSITAACKEGSTP